jgi:hypothetical protein
MQYGKATGKDQPYLISTNVKQGQNEQNGYSTLIRSRKTIENQSAERHRLSRSEYKT